MVSRSVKAHVVVLTGAASTTAGVFGLAGWPAAALAAGVQVLAYGLLFVDIDDKPKDPRTPRVIERGRQ